MALITQDNRDWIEAPSISDITESLKNKDNVIGRFFFMDYPAPETRKSDQS